MRGQDYFRDRLREIYEFSPIPYLSGEGELEHGTRTVRVRWEVCVPITGDPLFALSSAVRALIPQEQWCWPSRSFNQGTLRGHLASGETVSATGVIVTGVSLSSTAQDITYAAHFRQFEIIHQERAPTAIVAEMRNFTFLGTEQVIRGEGWYLGRFRTVLPSRTVVFEMKPEHERIESLIKSERIDRAILSEARIPLLGSEQHNDVWSILSNLEWLLSFLTLNRINSPIVRWLDGDAICRTTISDWFSDCYRHVEIMDNLRVPGGLKICLEQVYPNFAALDQTLGLRHLVDKLLQSVDQTSIDFQLAGLILSFEYLCTRYLTSQGSPPGDASSIQDKLRAANRYLRFIPSGLLDDTLRNNIRNPLFHTGAIPNTDMDALLGWYREYFELLIQIIFMILGYRGEYISRLNYEPARMPVPANP